jgi:hypothetical protein
VAISEVHPARRPVLLVSVSAAMVTMNVLPHIAGKKTTAKSRLIHDSGLHGGGHATQRAVCIMGSEHT